MPAGGASSACGPVIEEVDGACWGEDDPTSLQQGPTYERDGPTDGDQRCCIQQYKGDERDFLQPIMDSEFPYEEFLKQSVTHGRSPSFFLLAAQALHAKGRPEAEVLRAATNVLEL